MTTETCGFPSMRGAVLALYRRGCSRAQIAATVQVSNSTVRTILSVEGLTPIGKRWIKLRLSQEAWAALSKASRKRGTTISDLARGLLETIVHDNLVDAVIDDGD